jgi:hypothetical protein
MSHRASHRQTIGAVAVAQAADKWRLERPYGMTKPFLFVVAEVCYRLLIVYEEYDPPMNAREKKACW